MGVAVKPCEHSCKVSDLKYRDKNGQLKFIVCKVCNRTWNLADGVPDKGWPPRWFVNCPFPPVLQGVEGKGKDVPCKVDSCHKNPTRKVQHATQGQARRR